MPGGAPTPRTTTTTTTTEKCSIDFNHGRGIDRRAGATQSPGRQQRSLSGRRTRARVYVKCPALFKQR